jgi:integrase
LADELLVALEQLRAASAFVADDDLVFGHPETGKPLRREAVRKRFQRACRRAGVRVVRFHDLRHTFGTRVASGEVSLRTLQEWMGHRDAKTTLIYADYQPGEHEAAIVSRAFGIRSPVSLMAKRSLDLSASAEDAFVASDRQPLRRSRSRTRPASRPTRRATPGP